MATYLDHTTFLAGYEHEANGNYAVEPWMTGEQINIKASVPTPQAEGGASFQIDSQYAIEEIAYEATYPACLQFAAENPPGTWISDINSTSFAIQGGIFSVKVEKLPAGQGKIMFTMYKFRDETPSNGYPGESGNPSQGTAPFAEYYSVQNARYDIPISRYLAVGEASATYPDPYEFNKWEVEPDEALRKAYKYRDTETEQIVDLSTKTAAYAKKYIEGKEAVLRFWPVVTRTSLWWKQCVPFVSAPPTEAGDNNQRLGYICAPQAYSGLGESWLKIQDDLEGEGPVLTRTECWMASEKWDVNMYGWGDDRWPWGGDVDEEQPEA